MSKTIINSPKAPAPIGPYQQAVKVGNMLFVSGQIPIDQAKGTIVSDTVENEAKQVMTNLGYILEAAGLTFENVVKTSIFLKNMDDFQTINKIYGAYFKEETAPARETVQVARLPRDVSVEISIIAVYF